METVRSAGGRRGALWSPRPPLGAWRLGGGRRCCPVKGKPASVPSRDAAPSRLRRAHLRGLGRAVPASCPRAPPAGAGGDSFLSVGNPSTAWRPRAPSPPSTAGLQSFGRESGVVTRLSRGASEGLWRTRPPLAPGGQRRGWQAGEEEDFDTASGCRAKSPRLNKTAKWAFPGGRTLSVLEAAEAWASLGYALPCDLESFLASRP